MSTQQELTRTGITIPAQRQGSDEASSTTTPVAPAPAAAGAPAGWEAHSWWAVVRVASSRAVLTMVVSLLVWAVLPMALGWAPRVILSGSMEPLVHTGDVVVTRVVDAATLERGDVITTVDPDKAGKTRTHRYVQRDDDGQIVTKGDANREADSTPVSDDAVLGLGVLRVPYVGLPAYWLAERDTLAIGLGFAALSGLVLAAWSPRTGAHGPEGGDQRGGGTGGAGGAHRPTRRVRARGRRGSRAGAVATSITGVALSVALVVPGTYAAFSAPTQNASSGFTAASVFRAYAAAVLADAPSFYWRLDETSGTTVSDATGNGRNASADGVTFGRAGALPSELGSTAAGLDGGVILSSGSVASVGPAFSVETWVRTTSTTGGPLVALTNANNNGVIERALYVGNDGAVRFGRSASPRVTGPRVNDGGWHHVVYTNASTGNPTNQRAKLYVDGQLVATNSAITGSVTGYWDAGRSTFLVPALWQGMPDNTFRGDLDEIAVYTDVLSATEVAKHYTESGR